MTNIWDRWLPGVLSRRQLIDLCQKGYVRNTTEKDRKKIDHSSIDLHISNEAYELLDGSVKPFGDRYLHQIKDEGLAVPIRPDEDGTFTLHPKRTFLFRIRESLEVFDGSFWGQATGKSSLGRLDVLARLIVNGMDRYETFRPKVVQGGPTDMYVEVTPITFPIRVREGVALNQLRFFYGEPEDCEMRGPELLRTCFAGKYVDPGPTLSVELSTVPIAGGIDGCGYSAKDPPEDTRPIDVWELNEDEKPDPGRWWEVVRPSKDGWLKITKSRFYILRSKERLQLPPSVAVYARAIDEEIGEMRIHYAGFVHPNFGRERSDSARGTPLIFEVRGHDLNVSLRDGEIMAGLHFYRMSEDSDAEANVGKEYNDQILKLSKFFSEKWVTPPRVLREGEHEEESRREEGEDA